jgi:hypothetical protein
VNGTVATELAVSLVGLWLSFALLRGAVCAWRPPRLLHAGRYSEAAVAAERLERAWMRIFESVRVSARYSIGCARHLQGDFEGSLAALASIEPERVRGSTHYAVCSLEAANLVLLGRAPDRASALLEEAARIRRLPEDLLLAALAKLSLGDSDAAAALFDAAGTSRTGVGQQEAIFHTLRALYLLELGRDRDAQHDLEEAARSPIANVYVERARALLQTRVVGNDAPSSLAPQVVAKDTRED